MALADKLKEIDSITHQKKCNYQIMIDSMEPKEKEALENAWAAGYSQRIILRALRAEGYKTSNESIANHKSGNCKCVKN